MHCNSSGSPKPNITWYNPYNSLILERSNNNKYKIIDGINLQINFLEYKDSGIYRCLGHNQFSNNYMRKKVGSIFLTVNCKFIYHFFFGIIINNNFFFNLAPPIILNKSEKIHVNETVNRVELCCQTSGKPTPKVTWYKGDQLITNEFPYKYKLSQENTTLTILNLNYDDD